MPAEEEQNERQTGFRAPATEHAALNRLVCFDADAIARIEHCSHVGLTGLE